ncbi:hypothetical protein MKW92_005725 [Papaver armeniacum]|nr:hypothetical protein MKW92_005725 [Papaver armeniacum]
MSLFSKNTQLISLCHLFIRLHFWLSFVISIPLTSQGCHEQDRRALLDFRSSLEDPANRLSSWKDSYQHQNCCNWQGIRCSYDSFRVISIQLRNTDLESYLKESSSSGNSDLEKPNSALHGKFSPSLFKITLEYIDLALNNFQDSEIPLQISHLNKLTHLDLANSNLSSSISTQFANLTSLRYLDLSCTVDFSRNNPNPYYVSTSCLKLSSTKWMRSLGNLQVLRLSGIDLYETTSSRYKFAEHISYLSNLRDLDLSNCNIASAIFPINGFHNLSRLSSLKLSQNSGISLNLPVQLGNLTSLSTLDLSNCGLEGSVIPYFPQLKELDLSGNSNFHPDLVRFFQHQWPKLQRISLSFTNISGSIPSFISNAPLLVSLDAGYCSIQGTLPSSIYNLSRLQTLELAGNNITGYIDSSISKLKFLNYLDLATNKLQGFIPKSICNMFSLHILSLHSNNITGTIPGCISKLRNLTGNVSLISLLNELDLTSIDLRSSRRLTVVIDQNFSSYSKFKLDSLVLPSCNLKGLFPTFICELSNLRRLNLSHNHLTGVIPSCVSKLKNLYIFDVSKNKLSGHLPPLPFPPFDNSGSSSGGFSVHVLSTFDLSNNKLSGELSKENGKRLSSFSTINLAGNEFSGLIPFFICSKDSESNPTFMDFSNNNLSGIIPTSIGYCTYLNSLNLGANNLTGNVPSELQQLKSLSYLQLNDNNLDGSPLNFISMLQKLQVLNLANNHFGGRIPTVFGSLHDLTILSLRLNKFNGSIPEEIIHLKNLQILDLSENNLTGFLPRKIGNLMMLRSRPNDAYSLDQFLGYSVVSVQLQMVIKGIVMQFEKLYTYSSGVDLSCNALEGNIPYEIGLLQGLSTLNLSHNHFSGIIPKSVGNMSGLESLDLSFNKLSGKIPQSLVLVRYLGYLNLSYNNLSGRIPREAHFDTLSGDGSAYLNNSLLCGFYTNHTCEGDRRSNVTDSNPPNESYQDDKEDAKEKLLLYAIVALGFGVGFWGLFLVLLLKKEKWWFGYWRLVDVVALRVANICCKF